eukprot:280937-Chlamydomonas_euryale.AAC.1
MQEHLVVCAQLRGQLAVGLPGIVAVTASPWMPSSWHLLAPALTKAPHDQVDVDIEQGRGGGAALPHARPHRHRPRLKHVNSDTDVSVHV